MARKTKRMRHFSVLATAVILLAACSSGGDPEAFCQTEEDESLDSALVALTSNPAPSDSDFEHVMGLFLDVAQERERTAPADIADAVKVTSGSLVAWWEAYERLDFGRVDVDQASQADLDAFSELTTSEAFEDALAEVEEWVEANC